MTFCCEDVEPRIEAVTQLLDDTEILIQALTNVFLDNYQDYDIPPDELRLIQMYIASFSVMIPELRESLVKIKSGEYDTVDFTVGIIDTMDSYITKTRGHFEDLVENYNLQDEIN